VFPSSACIVMAMSEAGHKVTAAYKISLRASAIGGSVERMAESVATVAEHLDDIQQHTARFLGFTLSSDRQERTALFNMYVDEADPDRAVAAAYAWADTALAAAGVEAVFPSMRSLSPDEVRAFIAEFTETAWACAGLGTLTPLNAVVAAWRVTAEVHADPGLRAALTGPLEEADYGPVPEPPR
jgi:hypothetical protein